MENKNCPNCIKRLNSNTKIMEFVCKKSGLKCYALECPYKRDDYEDNYGIDSFYKKPHFDY